VNQHKFFETNGSPAIPNTFNHFYHKNFIYCNYHAPQTEGTQLHSDCRANGKSRPPEKEPVLDNAVREYLWLRDSHDTTSANKPAVRERSNTQWVPSALARACTVLSNRSFQIVRRPPQLVPLFPVGNYTPNSRCAHRGPIERGSVFCCMICHTSGQDDHPALQMNWSIEPNAEVKWTAAFSSNKYSKQRIFLETRKQRRQRLFSGSQNL
jgi:hypothetical protein